MAELAGPDDPLILRDGRRIDKTTGRVVKDAPLPRVYAPSSPGFLPFAANSARRRIEDVGIPAAMLSSLMAVAAFKLCGFDNIDICAALGTNAEMLVAVENHSDYSKVFDLLNNSAKDAAQNEARGILTVNAPRAAQKLVDNVDADDEVLSQAAALGILDRAGFRPGAEGGNSGNGSFRIEIVDKRDESNTPSINIKVAV